MAESVGDISVAFGADIAAFEAGVAKVQADLGKVAAAAEASSGRYADAQGKMREANGRFVSSGTLAAEAAGNVGGSLGKLSDVAGRAGQTINGGLVSSFAAFDKAVQPLNAGIGRLGEGIQSAGSSLSTYLTLPLTLLGGAAIAAAAKVDSLTRGLQAVAQQQLQDAGVPQLQAIAQAATETQQRLKDLRVVAQLPGLGFSEAIQGDIRLRAVGISADLSKKALLAFGNAIATTGGGKGELDRVTVQLGQLSAKGKVLAQDLRPIIEAAPAVAGALKRLYGTVDSETISASLQKQGKSSTDFINTLSDELGKLPSVSTGLKNALENISDSAEIGLAKFGQGISKAFDLEGLSAKVGNFITDIADAFANLDPATQKLIVFGAAGAAALGPLLVAGGAILAAIPSIVAGLEVLGVSGSVALGPIALVAAGVVAAALAVYENWDGIVSYFKGPNGAVFADVASAVGESISAIINAVKTLASGPIGTLIDLFAKLELAFVGKTIQAALAVISSAFSIVAGDIRIATDLLSGNFSKALDDARAAASAALKPFQDLLGLGQQKSSSFADFFKGMGPAAKEAGDGVDYFSDEVDKAGTKVLTLKELNAELKAALQTRFADAQAGNDTTADDANIARIRALIAEYKQLPGHVDAASKAFADVQKSLRAVGQESLALGDQYDYLKARQSATESGIKKLVGAGFSPASTAVQKLVADLRNLNTTLGDNTLLSGRKVEGSDKLFKTPDFKLKLPEKQELPDLSHTVSSMVVEDPILPDYKKIFSDAAKLIASGTGDLRGKFVNFTQVQADFNTQTEALIDQFPAQAFEQIGQSIGQAIGSGADVLQSFGQALLKTMGQFLVEYGRLIILKGAGDIALGNIGQGVAELAAGTALQIGGGLVSSLGSGGGGGGGGGGANLASAPNTPTAPAAKPTPAPAPVTIIHEVRMVQRGADLTGAIQIQQTRTGRVLGGKVH